ncbi:MAG: exopolyphosphatase [Bacteroidetes bacterium]|nr:exopolyphosphatase [Bacteroidota bacterium]
MMSKNVAVIDLGTNTFHLMIVRLGADFAILHREKQPVKLGQGGINQDKITDEALLRAKSCMIQFGELIKRYHATDIRGIGTSALRSAQNAGDVLKELEAASGISVNIISGDEEANYIYHGVKWAAPMGDETSLIVDIGGGSVEFIIASQSKVHWKKSFDIGAQRLLERFHRHDPILTEEKEALDKYLQQELKPLHLAMADHRIRTLIGSSGTFDTLSEIYSVRNGLRYSGEAPETPLTIEGVQTIHRDLVSLDRAGRLKIPGMIEMRVDMIVVASCLIQYLLKHFEFERVRVSTYSLKEGVIARDFLLL